ncbi:hypothetical protein EOD41_07720 [Mucilaginibacter limnophilus]|uniref:Tetratricopeptide repeat protein n=1 Tax=Mucilaginibacter limnophilus TaxID=1932778 RepID=A0A437MW40_9SPHI|nr:hypothetical protein [Mucilaginibacter limnophilus]RVU01836.1 hypothetical protein EOD41_07720 [Mucilaginibacter limnophilus]
MKEISKIAMAALPLIFAGSSVFSQSLDDAKKAIDAEQYQKATSMLKNLTVTQADKDENYFYLGWVYILQDYPDSAKTVFNQGIAKNAKSALNYAGLGAVARLEKNSAGATTNFNQAISLAGKSSTPYLYVGKAYLLDPADAKAAADVLNKGKAVNGKDADLLVTLGDANRLLVKSSDALNSYEAALTANPKEASAIVAKGVLWKFANNFEQSEAEFKAALALDPNYGPAYREWAETDLRWAFNDPKMASAKVKEGLENYKKYLSLTDRSVESRIRYAEFLLLAGDYKALQAEVAELTKMSTNLKVQRYLGYSAVENKDYPTAVTALNKFMSEAGEKRIIPRDYIYLGRAQIGTGKDSLGINTLKKAIELDSTQADLYAEIGKTLFTKQRYVEAGDAYNTFIAKGKGVKLTDHFYEGLSYYYGFQKQYFSTNKEVAAKADTSLLTKADSAFAYVIDKTASSPYADAFLFRARTNDYKDADRNNIKGLAKPYYEKYIEVVNAKGAPTDQKGKTNLAEAYAYLGTLAEFKDKDEAKASENYTKARELDPANKSAQRYFQKKSSAGR